MWILRYTEAVVDLKCQIDDKSAVRRMRNSGRRSREDKRSNSKGNATDGDDDDDDEGDVDDVDEVCVEGTSSSAAISVVEAIVKQKVLEEEFLLKYESILHSIVAEWPRSIQGVPFARGLGCVDFNFDCSTVCPILLGLMGIWLKQLETKIKVNTTQIHEQIGHPVQRKLGAIIVT